VQPAAGFRMDQEYFVGGFGVLILVMCAPGLWQCTDIPQPDGHMNL